MVFPCVTCRREYSEIDIATRRLFPTGVCSRCYSIMLETHACFGKKYDSDLCPLACPDREVCPNFKAIMNEAELDARRRQQLLDLVKASSRLRRAQLREIRNREIPFMAGSIIARIFKLCLDGTTIEEIQELAKTLGVDPKEYMRKIRKGAYNGWIWIEAMGSDGKRLDGLGGRAWQVQIVQRPKT